MAFTKDQEAFVIETLHAWGEKLEKLLTEQLKANNIGVTDDLLRSLSFEVLKTTNPEFRLTFKEYGRMRDMGVGRGRKIESAATTREIITGTGKANKSLKKARWYSKTTYGSMNALMGQLSFGYQEAAVDSVIKNLIAA